MVWCSSQNKTCSNPSWRRLSAIKSKKTRKERKTEPLDGRSPVTESKSQRRKVKCKRGGENSNPQHNTNLVQEAREGVSTLNQSKTKQEKKADKVIFSFSVLTNKINQIHKKTSQVTPKLVNLVGTWEKQPSTTQTSKASRYLRNPRAVKAIQTSKTSAAEKTEYSFFNIDYWVRTRVGVEPS